MKKIVTGLAVFSLPCALFGGAYDKLFENGLLRFNYTPAELTALEATARAELEENLSAVTAVPSAERDFENTALAVENAYTNYWFVPKALSLLAYFHEDANVRAAAAELETKGSRVKTDFFTRREVYRALKEYANTKPALDAEQQRMLDKWLVKFERNGMGLSDKDLKKFVKLNSERLDKITRYNVNLNNYRDQLELTRQELEGMEETYINRLSRTEEGKYIVTLKYPDYNPFMANAKNEATRKALQTKFARRGGKENVKLLEDTLLLRSKTARLLGYEKYPDYVLPSRMARNDENLEAFLKDLEKQIRPLADGEMKEYLALKKEMTGQESRTLNAWETAYWANQYKKRKYAVDDEKIKEYFPADKVISGMFDTFGPLFGLTFESAALPAWHKDVQTYIIKDKKSGEMVSYFYLDAYPRDGKYTHAATWSFVDRFQKPDGSYQIPSVVIAANFTPAGGGLPALLTHSDVVTLFHEFGHVLQMSLATSRYASLTGDNVAWDYIETHSQLLENWAWQPQVLKNISAHYQTGEPLPDELITALVRSRRAGEATVFLRQNFLGQFDVDAHASNKRVNTTKLYGRLMEQITGTPLTKGTYPQASFGHIMSLTDPYDVGYYVYAWSLVIAEDIFAQFAQQGLFNKELGAKLREYIYTPGTAKDENEMVEAFLGRPYNNKAFLKSLGITEH